MSDSSDGTKCAADHGPRRNVREREVEWSALMHSADAGDGAAYSRLLEEITPTLRATAERELVRAGLPAVRREAIVQEILLAVHLKRHMWGKNSSFVLGCSRSPATSCSPPCTRMATETGAISTTSPTHRWANPRLRLRPLIWSGTFKVFRTGSAMFCKRSSPSAYRSGKRRQS